MAKVATVGVVGRTNAGKSTLVNALVGEKVSIVSPVEQTTRNTVRTFFSYVGFLSIYLFLFVRSYRHLMYSMMNMLGLKEWMVNSYKFIAKANKLWKK